MAVRAVARRRAVRTMAGEKGGDASVAMSSRSSAIKARRTALSRSGASRAASGRPVSIVNAATLRGDGDGDRRRRHQPQPQIAPVADHHWAGHRTGEGDFDVPKTFLGETRAGREGFGPRAARGERLALHPQPFDRRLDARVAQRLAHGGGGA